MVHPFAVHWDTNSANVPSVSATVVPVLNFNVLAAVSVVFDAAVMADFTLSEFSGE